MKSFSFQLVIFLLMFATLCVANCEAQVAAPINFTMTSALAVEKTTLAPGSYTIRPFEQDSDALELTSSTGHSVLFACESMDSNRSKSELTFHRYGIALYLKQVSAGSGACFVPAGPSEKQAKKSSKPTKETVSASAK